MAETDPSSPGEENLKELISFVGYQINSLRGGDKEHEKHSSTQSSIRDIIEDAEEKQETEIVIQNFLNKFKSPAYDADGILDKYETEALRFKVEEGRAHNCHPGGQMNNTDQAQTSQRRKTRGPTRCLSLQSLPPNERIELTWNDLNQLVGEHAATFSRYCGMISRNGNTIPIDCETWKHVLEKSKRDAFKMVQEKYLVTDEHYDYVVNKVMSKKWRDHKSDLKCKYFNELNPHGSVPPSVIKDQWDNLVGYWLSDRGKKASETNKMNRQKQVLSHTIGTKTIARCRDEMTLDGRPPSRAELFIKTHSHKDGMLVNDVVAEKIAKMQQIRRSAPEGSIDSTGRDDVFSQVMGPDRRGRVRGYGLGPTPTTLWGPSSSGFSKQSFRSHLETIKELQEQMIVKNSTIEELQTKVEEMEAKARQSDEKSKNIEEMMLEMRNKISQIEQDRSRSSRS